MLDAFSRRIVGWSIDSRHDSKLVVNALDMAIRSRLPGPGGIVHADHGVQFTSWAFGDKIRAAGLLPFLPRFFPKTDHQPNLEHIRQDWNVKRTKSGLR